MKTKNYLFIVGIFLVTIITLSIIIALRPDENTGDEEISEELRAVRQTFVCELSEDKTHYIIFGLKNPEQRYDEIVFPSKIDDLPVSKIIDKKNQNFIDFKNVKKVFIPDSITYIGTDEKDNSIANRPFLQSTNLNEIVVDENNPVYASENGILYNKDKSILIRYPISRVEDEGTLSYSFNDNVTEIYNYAFANNLALLNISFNENITKIGSAAFYKCRNLRNVSFDENSNISVIMAYAFEDCQNIIKIDLPNGVTSIGSSAFRGCINLISIYIPSSVTSFGSHIFTGDYNLKTVFTDSENIEVLNKKEILDKLSLNKNAEIKDINENEK